MKKVFFMTLLSAGMFAFATRVEAQQHYYVKVRPHTHEVRRPPAPSHNHVWIGSEWNWRDGKYVESPGHWEVPPRGHKRWVEGHWAKASRGSYWITGHWG
jgi:hypothetical protein